MDEHEMDAWNDSKEAMARLRRAFRSGDKERIRRAWRNARRVTRDDGVTRREFNADVQALRQTTGIQSADLDIVVEELERERTGRSAEW